MPWQNFLHLGWNIMNIHEDRQWLIRTPARRVKKKGLEYFENRVFKTDLTLLGCNTCSLASTFASLWNLEIGQWGITCILVHCRYHQLAGLPDFCLQEHSPLICIKFCAQKHVFNCINISINKALFWTVTTQGALLKIQSDFRQSHCPFVIESLSAPHQNSRQPSTAKRSKISKRRAPHNHSKSQQNCANQTG